MSWMEWSVFAVGIVAVGVIVGVAMRLMERKTPKYLD
jgi:uncharacterized membrane-anchored protein YhcB (DUF1043 family)